MPQRGQGSVSIASRPLIAWVTAAPQAAQARCRLACTEFSPAATTFTRGV